MVLWGHMQRREFITLLGGAATTWTLSTRSIASDRPLIGYFAGGRQSVVSDLVNAFQKGLGELGYSEGVNYEITYRFAEGRVERLAHLAEEIVRLRPAVILAGAVDTALALRHETSTIPIVSPALADAVDLGLVKSYPHPGGNVTGITPYVTGLPLKQIELAREVVPGATKLGVLGNLNDPKAPPQRDEMLGASKKLGVEVIIPEVEGREDVIGAMRTFADERVDAVIVLQTTMLLSERDAIAALAASARLPAIYGYRQHVEAGGLISYGVDLRWSFHRAAFYVSKILQGTMPGELPVEFPSKVEMVINLKTAKTLGLALPATLLARADEVIE
jgi:putative tryptophan/tyrosine transport system substrate-binding protein